MGEMPIIDEEKCNGCGLCISVCLCNALAMSKNNVVTIMDKVDCPWCLQCEVVCPTGAIAFPFEIVFE